MKILRVLGREPGFALFAIVTLALGIGASTAMFSALHAIVLSPPPFADPVRVMALSTAWTDTGRAHQSLSGGDWEDLRFSGIFEAVGRYGGGELGLQLRGRAEFAEAYLVSPSFFRVFDLAAVRGRIPGVSDAFRGAVVSARFAERALGGIDHAVGKVFELDTRQHEIVGVLPAEFGFPARGDVWITMADRAENLSRTSYQFPTVAKLRAGIAPESVQSRLDGLAAGLAAAHPASNQNKTFTAVPLRRQMAQTVRQTVFLLMGAVVLVLLIACANVAHLLLARGVERTREFAVRAALGASRWRIVMLLLRESLLIGLSGGALGVLLAYAAVRGFVALAPANLPRLAEVRVDVPVLAFAVTVSLLSSVLFGLAPAWQLSRLNVIEGLRAAGARGTLGDRMPWLRDVLVVGEIALSFALCTGAGLLVRSFVQMNAEPLGFRTDGVLVVYAHVPANSMPEMKAATRWFEQTLHTLRQIPGVVSASAAMGLPAGRYNSNGLYFTEGRNALGSDTPSAGLRLAGPGYFTAMRIPLTQGRQFDARDQYDAPFVAIVSETLARRSFPNENPIGKRIRCALDAPEKWMTIVGVAGDVRSKSPAAAPAPELYMPFQQHPVFANEMQVILRAKVSPEILRVPVERIFRASDPSVAIKVTTMEEMVRNSTALPRFRTWLIGLFAGIAILLAMAGVYGVLAYLVARRTAEFGLRVALGAGAGRVLLMVLRKAALLAAAGLSLGVVLAVAGSRLMESLLFGLQHTDTAIYVTSAALLAGVVLAAAGVPAIRAARIDPATALREE